MSEIIHGILEFITGLGYWGILLGLAIEVIPSEIVLAYAGYLVFRGEINVVEAVIFGTIGCLLQQIVLYWIGQYGGRPFIAKYGKILHIKMSYIDITERWFQKYGAGVVFTARFVPVLRQAISIPAGIAKMNLFKFLLYTGLASIPWAVIFIMLGKSLGENWEQIDEIAAPYTKPLLIGAVVLTAAYIGWKLLTRKKKPAAGSTTGSAAGYVGERTAALELQKVGSEYRVFNRIRMSARTGNQEIDHVVVGPNGVFHIETKNWEGRIRFTEKGAEHGPKSQKEDPTATLYRHEFALKELLRGNKLQADVVGLLCFSSPNASLEGEVPSFTAVRLDSLVSFIRGRQAKHALSPEEVRRISELLETHSIAI